MEEAKADMDAATKATQVEARAKSKTPASETPTKVEPTPAVAPAGYTAEPEESNELDEAA
jgi:hypothetical protein